MPPHLLLFPGGRPTHPEVEAWFQSRPTPLSALARHWFLQIRAAGPDLLELLHDGAPTATLHDAGFAYVNVFTHHVNLGFFHGAALPDPARLLQGAGKHMRHVKLRPEEPLNEPALKALLTAAYQDLQARLAQP